MGSLHWLQRSIFAKPYRSFGVWASIREFLSPRNTWVATGFSMLVHGGMAASVFYLAKMSLDVSPEKVHYMDVGGVILDESPVMPKKVPEIRTRVKIPAAPPAIREKVVREIPTQELQNEESSIAGTQKRNEENNDSTGQETKGAESAAVPYYKIKPKYPRAALVAGIEGWVLLKIDITEEGEVENIRVIDGEQRDLFQNEARRAVSRWKYPPFHGADGRIVAKADFQVLVNFKLEEQKENNLIN